LKFKGVLLIENNNLRIREEEARETEVWCEGGKIREEVKRTLRKLK